MSTLRRWILTMIYTGTTLCAGLYLDDLGTLWTVRHPHSHKSKHPHHPDLGVQVPRSHSLRISPRLRLQIFGSTTGWAVMFAIPASVLMWSDGPWGLAADNAGHTHSGFISGSAARGIGWIMMLLGTAICAYCIYLSV